jgi:hypothetical protein
VKDLKYSELRHDMLAAIASPGPHGIYLTCANRKRSVWKPRVHGNGQFNLSSSQARAVNDLLAVDLAHTPGWQGDMDVERPVKLTVAGAAVLAEWDVEYHKGEQ